MGLSDRRPTESMPDRPGSPGHLGLAGSPPIPMGAPDRRPTESMPDRPGSPSHLGPAGLSPITIESTDCRPTESMPDRPGSPGHLGPAELSPILVGTPDRRPTGSMSPGQDPSTRSLGHEGNTTTVPDILESPKYSSPAGELSIVMGSQTTRMSRSRLLHLRRPWMRLDPTPWTPVSLVVGPL